MHVTVDELLELNVPVFGSWRLCAVALPQYQVASLRLVGVGLAPPIRTS